MRSVALFSLALAAGGAWGFVPNARLTPARARVATHRANGLRMDADGPKLAKIEQLKVRACVRAF